jgi:tetratricopeptide (TPR) repeat protein
MKRGPTTWLRTAVAAWLLLAIGASLTFIGWYQKHGYLDRMASGVGATEEARFDNLDFDRAQGNLFASHDLLAYDRAVRASAAGQRARAARQFQDVIVRSPSPALRAKAYYNLGNLFVLRGKAREAAEMYREALRLDPSDWEAKSNLETLYEAEATENEGASASLTQARDPGEAGSELGQGGPGPGRAGI